MESAPRRWLPGTRSRRAPADPREALEVAISGVGRELAPAREGMTSAIEAERIAMERISGELDRRDRILTLTRDALAQADRALDADDDPTVSEQTLAAESFAGRLLAVERRLPELRREAERRVEAADRARVAWRTRADELTTSLAEACDALPDDERTSLQGPLDRAQRLIDQGREVAQPRSVALLEELARRVGEAPPADDVRTRLAHLRADPQSTSATGTGGAATGVEIGPP